MSNTAQQSKPGTGVIGPVRFSYLYVYEPRVNKLRPDDDPEYSVTVLVPKAANEFCPDPAAVKDRLVALAKEALKEKFGDKLPPNCANPVKDGDKELNASGEPRNPGYWYVKAKCGFRPTLLDGYKNPVDEQAGWVSGDWGFVKLSFYGYDQAGNRGASAGLRAIQFTRKDEPLSGNSFEAVASEFDTVEGDTPTNAGTGGYDPFADED